MRRLASQTLREKLKNESIILSSSKKPKKSNSLYNKSVPSLKAHKEQSKELQINFDNKNSNNFDNNNLKGRKLVQSATAIPKAERAKSFMAWRILQNNLDYDSLMSRKIDEENGLPYLASRKGSFGIREQF